MTALCSGGTSGTIGGVGGDVVLGGAALAALVTKRLGAWATPFLANIGNVVLDIATYCSTDPPAMPSNTDIAAALVGLAGLPFNSNSDVSVLVQAIQHVIWSDFCQCSTGVIPTPPTPIAAPSGTPAFNPGLGTSLPATPCWNAKVSAIGTSFEGTQLATTLFTGTPTTVFYTNPHTGSPGEAYAGIKLPQPLPTEVDITLTAIGPFAGADFGIALNVLWFSTTGSSGVNGTFLHSDTTPTTLNAPGTTSMSLIPPPTAVYAIVDLVDGTASSGQTCVCQVSTTWTCGSGLSGVCCPAGPDNTQALNQIMSMLTLIQRQLAPFAYELGTAHAGLSGDGSFSVSGILGIKVDLTTTPGRLGIEVGDPNTLFGAGWVNIGFPDGFGPRQFISNDPFLVLPISPSATVVGYSIPADVVVTITELVREP